MFCTKCGNKLKEGMRFCTQCGTPVAEKAPAAVEKASAGNTEASAEKKAAEMKPAASVISAASETESIGAGGGKSALETAGGAEKKAAATEATAEKASAVNTEAGAGKKEAEAEAAVEKASAGNAGAGEGKKASVTEAAVGKASAGNSGAGAEKKEAEAEAAVEKASAANTEASAEKKEAVTEAAAEKAAAGSTEAGEGKKEAETAAEKNAGVSTEKKAPAASGQATPSVQASSSTTAPAQATPSVQAAASEQASAAPVPPVYVAPQPPQSAKKKKGILPIVLICILILIILGVLGVLFLPKLFDKTDESEGDETDERTEASDEDEEEPEEEEPAPINYPVHVLVLDEAQESLEGVTVELISGETVTETAETDEDGRAEFTLPLGTYSLRLWKDGYEESYENVVISEGRTEEYTVEVELSSSLVELAVRVISTVFNEGCEGATVTITDTASGETQEAQTDGQGLATFDVAYGEYDIDCSAAGYHDESAQVSVEGATELRQLMVPQMDNEQAISEAVYILLEWEGQYDLDVVLFNSHSGEYVTISHEHDEYNSFIYADNNEAQGYELLCLRNRFKDGAQTIYVVDVQNAQSASESTMEADGVKLRVYSENGVRTITPDETQNAPVWMAFYYEGGERHDFEDNNYISDETALAWTQDIK